MRMTGVSSGGVSSKKAYMSVSSACASRKRMRAEGTTRSRSIWLMSPVLTSDMVESLAMLICFSLRSSRSLLPLNWVMGSSLMK